MSFEKAAIASCEALLAANKTLKAEARKYRRALLEIRRSYGKVCPDFELCTHTSCQSSYGAWAVADKALRVRRRVQ